MGERGVGEVGCSRFAAGEVIGDRIGGETMSNVALRPLSEDGLSVVLRGPMTAGVKEL